ncbi:MAG: type II toxin-antitoxin system VapC family toxin [Thermomicrobiales bacterium]
MPSLERRYFDSCIFIYVITNHPQHGSMCTEAIRAAEQGQFKLVTSMLTMIEVIKERSGPHTPSEATQKKIADFFEHDYVLMVQASRQIMLDARQLCWKYGGINLKGNDAVHLATALYAKCSVLYTYDDTLLKTKEPGLSVERPQIQVQAHIPGIT